jgi:hypothetical protein
MTHKDHPAYWPWIAMRQRCRNTKSKDYARWGARGITVCQRWDSFDAFCADMGRARSEVQSIALILTKATRPTTAGGQRRSSKRAIVAMWFASALIAASRIWSITANASA